MAKLSYCLLFCIWLATLVMDTSSYSKPFDLNQFLQPDEVTRTQFLSGNNCARQCRRNEPPRLCYYKWVAENYVTVGHACRDCPNNLTDCYAPQCVPADGYEKGILTINRRIPGPSIEVCLGDRIVVDYTNKMAARSSSIHWHGVFQKGTPYMDGVPGLTQCSIHEGNTFRYDFWANNEGTHYWHSHDGLQKLDGIQGHLIVRTPKEDDPNGKLYHEDYHKIIILDWVYEMSDELYPGYRYHRTGQDAENFLMNGYGRTKLPESQGNRSSDYPFAEITVVRNRRYRLRIVGGLCTVCGVQFSIEGHNMMVIATDGNPVKPVTVNSINIYSGERYDVVLTANQPPRKYWIHMRGLSLCAENRVFGLGILTYANVSSQAFNSEEPGYDGFNDTNVGKVLNPENATCGGESNNICVTDLQSTSQSTGPHVCNIVIPLSFGFKVFGVEELFRPNTYERFYVVPDTTLMTSWMNNMSFTAPSSPLLSQYKESMKERCPIGRNGLPTCPANTKKEEICECTQVITVPLRSNICIALADGYPTADLHHSFHLHGYAFYILAMEQFKNGQTIEDITAALRSRSLPLAKNPGLKDAVAVPSNGYAVIKFYTDNPGIWFFHCHFEYHLATGMAVAIQVGGPRDWPPVPEGFPRCGNYQPPVHYEDNKFGMNYPDYYYG